MSQDAEADTDARDRESVIQLRAKRTVTCVPEKGSLPSRPDIAPLSKPSFLSGGSAIEYVHMTRQLRRRTA
jgi:hypothetical protein